MTTSLTNNLSGFSPESAESGASSLKLTLDLAAFGLADAPESTLPGLDIQTSVPQSLPEQVSTQGEDESVSEESGVGAVCEPEDAFNSESLGMASEDAALFSSPEVTRRSLLGSLFSYSLGSLKLMQPPEEFVCSDTAHKGFEDGSGYMLSVDEGMAGSMSAESTLESGAYNLVPPGGLYDEEAGMCSEENSEAHYDEENALCSNEPVGSSAIMAGSRSGFGQFGFDMSFDLQIADEFMPNMCHPDFQEACLASADPSLIPGLTNRPSLLDQQLTLDAGLVREMEKQSILDATQQMLAQNGIEIPNVTLPAPVSYPTYESSASAPQPAVVLSAPPSGAAAGAPSTTSTTHVATDAAPVAVQTVPEIFQETPPAVFFVEEEPVQAIDPRPVTETTTYATSSAEAVAFATPAETVDAEPQVVYESYAETAESLSTNSTYDADYSLTARGDSAAPVLTLSASVQGEQETSSSSVTTLTEEPADLSAAVALNADLSGDLSVDLKTVHVTHSRAATMTHSSVATATETAGINGPSVAATAVIRHTVQVLETDSVISGDGSAAVATLLFAGGEAGSASEGASSIASFYFPYVDQLIVNQQRSSYAASQSRMPQEGFVYIAAGMCLAESRNLSTYGNRDAAKVAEGLSEFTHRVKSDAQTHSGSDGNPHQQHQGDLAVARADEIDDQSDYGSHKDDVSSSEPVYVPMRPADVMV
ncbi:MAG: hypothetical protein HQM16_15890 [Deltaproteobacteria bacterium]|nr:hypothetical protein [Deltaproteobacteria bacterium]